MINASELKQFKEWKANQLTFEDVKPIEGSELIQIGDTLLTNFPNFHHPKFIYVEVVGVRKTNQCQSGFLIGALFGTVERWLDLAWFYMEVNNDC
jgi:hypothetical protein